MKKFIDVLKFTDMPEPVDCGGCPASFECMADGSGGNGYKFSCCGATGFQQESQDPLLVLDCQQNTFDQNSLAAKVKSCPLCSGDIVEATLRGYADNHYYVPTVHAKRPLSERLQTWRKALNRRQKDVGA